MTNSIAVIGLGYVGLPLALEFSKKYDVIGFDVSKKRIKNLSGGVDETQEVLVEDLNTAKISFTDSLEDIATANVYIVCVPTPIDTNNNPDLSPWKVLVKV